MIGSLLSMFLVGLLVLVVAGIALSIVGFFISAALGLAGFLLFKVAPILFVGWVVLKVLEARRGKGELSAADRRWLDGGS